MQSRCVWAGLSICCAVDLRTSEQICSVSLRFHLVRLPSVWRNTLGSASWILFRNNFLSHRSHCHASVRSMNLKRQCALRFGTSQPALVSGVWSRPPTGEAAVALPLVYGVAGDTTSREKSITYFTFVGQ